MNEESNLSEGPVLGGGEDLSPLPSGPKNKTAMVVVVVLVILVGGYFGFKWIQFRRTHVSTDDARVKGTMVTVSPRVPGRIEKITVEEGDQVKVDKLLVKMDPTEIREKVEIARADFNSAVSELQKARLSYELQKEHVRADLDQARAAVEVSQSRLKQSQEDLEMEIKTRAEQISSARAALKASRATMNESTARVDMAKAEYKDTRNSTRRESSPNRRWIRRTRA